MKERICEQKEAEPRHTPLGRQLWVLRQQIVAAGEPLLDWDQIREEVRQRRGEQNPSEQQR